jgi:YidC/Oxa1 family membrane protein insertase
MLDNNQQPKLFDSRTVLAIAIIGVFYLGWQKYLSTKYPQLTQSQKTEQKNSQNQNAPVEKPANNSATQGFPAVVDKTSATDSKAVVQNRSWELGPEQLVTYEDEKVTFKITNHGMGVVGFKSKNYFDRKNKPVSLTLDDRPVYAFVWGPENRVVEFQVTQSENQFRGVALVGEFKIERTLTYNPNSYSFDQEIKIDNPEGKQTQYSLLSYDRVIKPESSSWLFPSFEFQDLLVFTGLDKKEHLNVSQSNEDLKGDFKTLKLYSLGTQYFTTGLLDQSDIKPDLKFSSDANEKTVLHALIYSVPQTVSALYKQAIFIGPKSSENLKAANEGFVALLDYGMFGWLAKPMLAVMKWFYGIVGNWGIAIILLTLLVRALVLPFNLMSYRSMKGMQVIQPQLQSLREKYKDDPVTLNREMMTVMKQNNANPLAGCLPMLLQIPVFFALYRVIGSSVELYQAPFYGWIQDLSLHDKFYVLPVLMAATFYIQQKITPTTMDPAQARIMLWIPVVFCLFMLNLPAGLTLYMFISAVFGIIQQKTFMKVMS